MIGLIITGHGNFATGLQSSLQLIAGDLENFVAVDFPGEYSTDDLERELNTAYDTLKDCEGVLVMSDLAGGSPFKTAVMSGFPKGNVEVVGGTNLPMIIEINMARKFIEDLGMLTEMALNTGKDQVVRYEHVAVKQEEPEDGI